MNILPKKRWHVRTKENIARVRRDEAKAEEEEREKQRRIKLADQEARMSLLRQMAVDKLTDEQKTQLGKFQEFQRPAESEASTSNSHVNFFEELESGESGTTNGNAEREKEKKKEQEEYEKKIGLLTYLGQDTNELTGQKAWWEKVDRGNEDSEKSKDKFKDLLDPLNSVRKYLGTEGVKSVVTKKSSKSSSSPKKKHKKEKKSKKSKKSSKKSKKSKRHKTKSSSEQSDDSEKEDLERIRKQQKLEKLRQERLKREMKEREKANHVLYGTPMSSLSETAKKTDQSEDKRKYNSQFNPHLAKQNKLDAKEKYWLQQ